MSKYSFKSYILNENKAFLAQRIGDVLNAIQELSSNAGGMGARELVKGSETIVNQIRRILHTSWPKTELPYLPPLQKVGVAIMKAIEEKDDLKQVLLSAASELQDAVSKTGEPINTLGGQNPPNAEDKPMAPPQKESPAPKQPQQSAPQQQQPQQPQQPQPQPQPNQPIAS